MADKPILKVVVAIGPMAGNKSFANYDPPLMLLLAHKSWKISLQQQQHWYFEFWLTWSIDTFKLTPKIAFHFIKSRRLLTIN